MLERMKQRTSRGFTIVEVTIVLVIMVILMTLAIVGFRSSQANARDEKRHADIEVIVQQLENYYTVNYDDVSNPIALHSGQGRYPSTSMMNSETNIRAYLPDLPRASLRAPNVDTSNSPSLIPATNANTNLGGVSPQPTLTTYVYQPLRSNNSLCTAVADDCKKFTIYYRVERPSSNCDSSGRCAVKGQYQ